jgi:hypothetical protein
MGYDWGVVFGNRDRNGGGIGIPSALNTIASTLK